MAYFGTPYILQIFFVWADLVILSSDVQCSSFEPVHSVIIESRQTKCPPFGRWYMGQEASIANETTPLKLPLCLCYVPD